MIKLVVGLGNPGQQYEKTRHNAGFLFLEQFVFDWAREVRFHGWCSTCYMADRRVVFLKPDTFMNRSGQSVGALMRYHKINSDEVLVVHDELDFEVGIVKLKKGGGHAGHNGLRDIILHLDSSDFYRLRIGVGRPETRVPVADYVLSLPSQDDMEKIYVAFGNGRQLVDKLIARDKNILTNK